GSLPDPPVTRPDRHCTSSMLSVVAQTPSCLLGHAYCSMLKFGASRQYSRRRDNVGDQFSFISKHSANHPKLIVVLPTLSSTATNDNSNHSHPEAQYIGDWDENS